MNKFADSIHINVGALSHIFNGKRSISVKQLDRITAGMQLEEGHLYKLYITEISDQKTMNWRKIKPLLKRCADLHRLEDIKNIVRLTLDNLAYIPLLFEVAESFFDEEKNEAAIILYEGIAESEQSQHSERLALCQYRLFRLRINDDQENNLLLVTQFEPYVERLEEAYQLDAGIQYIIESLESAIKINNKNTKLKCITAIFEISLHHEDYSTNQTFKNLMSDVLEISKKSQLM